MKKIFLLYVFFSLIASIIFAACNPDGDDDDPIENVTDLLEGRTYVLDIATNQWSKPFGIGEIIGSSRKVAYSVLTLCLCNL